MIKILHVAAIAGLIGSAVWAYSIKYETIRQTEELTRLERAIAREREMIAVLRAEWAFLNRPDRVETLADAHLPEIVPFTVEHLARFEDLPERPPAADAIGAKLEALGLAAPTATPGTTGSIPVRTQTTPTTRTPAR
ncbi:cell division protein FtsL [Salinarimonas chemoclinalis]|uniref:cell division protein FtsL n=1 Tax=Salinarimonas chemoclinalis TaxID=3241599 RepID=UPI00355810CE